jgi:hypothetical protein
LCKPRKGEGEEKTYLPIFKFILMFSNANLKRPSQAESPPIHRSNAQQIAPFFSPLVRAA